MLTGIIESIVVRLFGDAARDWLQGRARRKEQQLSDAELELLRAAEASTQYRWQLRVMKMEGAPQIHAGRSFNDDPNVRAEYWMALQELIRRNLVAHESGAMYPVTVAGVEAVRRADKSP